MKITERKTIKSSITKSTNVVGFSFALFLAVFSPKTYAQDPPAPAPNGASARSFYEVLDEVLSDFEYDLKSGQVGGLKDLSIRNVVTSENIPPSFKSHLELLISERILKTTKTRIVHCIACRSKRATLEGDSMVISSPESNSTELARVAKMNGIQNFMDVAFAYQPSGMILSLEISDTETGSLIWSKSYNSDSTRAAAQKRGVDYQEIDAAKTTMEYQPTIQMRPVLYTVFEPKASSGYATELGLGFRMMERYDNRKKEVGFEVNYLINVPSLIGEPGASTDKTNIYTGFNLTFVFTHALNLFGDEENYNKARGQIFAGIGGTYASGFLGALVRGGYEWHLARHWAVTTFLGYRPESTVVISTSYTAPLSGVEGGLGVGFLF